MSLVYDVWGLSHEDSHGWGWLKWICMAGGDSSGWGMGSQSLDQDCWWRLWTSISITASACGLDFHTVRWLQGSKTSYPGKVTASRASVPENKAEAAWILWLGFRSYIVSLLPYSTGWSYNKPAQTQGKGTETLISMKILSKNVRQYFKTAT